MKIYDPTKRRDLYFFLITFFIAVTIAFLPVGNTKAAIAPLYIVIYLVYLVKVFTANDVKWETVLDPLILHVLAARLRNGTVNEKENPPVAHTVVQVALSLVLIIGGAQLFVNQIVSLAESLHVSATILSLIVAPVATELPEKLNSVIWVRQGKDVLALGNITGAMILQSCIPMAFGIAFTSWVLGRLETINVSLTLVAVASLYIQAIRDRLTARSFLFNGVFYFMFLALVIISAYYPL